MATLFLGAGLLKITSDTNTAITTYNYRFYDGRNTSTIVVEDSNNSLNVMRHDLEEIYTLTILHDNRYLTYQSMT